ncbi:MAG: RNA polymerase sigma factor [Phycisphaerae bacterium]
MSDDAGQEPNAAAEARERDADAVRRTLDGDLTAFDRLIEVHQRRAVAVAYRLLGNIDDAMDVCQDAFVRAFRSLATLADPARFGGWLMRIVSNRALNYRRDRRRTVSLSTGNDDPGVDENTLADRPEHGSNPAEGRLLTAETEQAVSKAIEQLPDRQRLALVLFAIEGLPQKEVAEILECSVEVVKWSVFQARKTLKETLSEYLT